EAGNVLDVELPLGPDATVVARLRRFDIVAPDATIVDEGPGGVRTPVPVTVSTWTGHLLDDPDADVFIGFSPTQAQGWIATRGTTFLIATRPTPAGPLTLAYDQNKFDMPGALTPAACQGALIPPGQSAPPPTEDAGYETRVACTAFQVAIETDEEFASVAGGTQNAADYAIILVAANNIIYVRELGMGLRLSYLRTWSTTDPWTGTGTLAQLNEFVAYWQANMSSVSRASAHMFSGRALGGGIAYVRAACLSGYGYAVSANLVASFPFPIQDNASSNWDLMVVAHEWGHQFGTGHTHNSCEYSPIIDGCGLRTTSSSCENGTQDCSVATAQNGTIMSYCHTCSGGMRNMKMTFGSRVISRMNSYIGSIASCGSLLDPPSLSSIAASPSASVCTGVPVTLTANATGTELRFQWYRNGTRVFGATAATHTITSPVNGDRWDVMVYSPCGVILTQGTASGVVLSVAASGVVLNGQGTQSFSDAAGNANGRIDSGESSIAITIPIRNAGSLTATGVSATLVSNTPTVTVPLPSASYPDLAACVGTASNALPFLIDVAPSHLCGDPISLTLIIVSAQGGGSYDFSLATGLQGSVSAPATVAYAGSPVAIPDNDAAGATATISVAGLVGSIVDVDVRFDGSACNADAGSATVGLDHTYVGDLSISLTSPSGTTVNLMNRPGGDANGGRNFCGTLLDDAASSSIQAIVPGGNPWTGSFTPASPLADFNGLSPNGQWSLRVVDAAPVDVGFIRAFSLVITTRTPSTCDPVCQRPVLSTQPTSRTACAGSSTTFTVVATGTPSPTFQWRKGGAAVDGATSASFTIASVVAADAASYDCVVTNACGSVTSA
ncbi:MAG: M12 family metallo-peptidase, partial [Phycisphaerales bacterium]